MREETQCAIMIRERSSHEWQFCTYVERPSVALRSAEQMVAQERLLGRSGFQAKVMKRSDYEAGKLRASVRVFK